MLTEGHPPVLVSCMRRKRGNQPPRHSRVGTFWAAAWQNTNWFPPALEMKANLSTGCENHSRDSRRGTNFRQPALRGGWATWIDLDGNPSRNRKRFSRFSFSLAGLEKPLGGTLVKLTDKYEAPLWGTTTMHSTGESVLLLVRSGNENLVLFFNSRVHVTLLLLDKSISLESPV